MAPLIPSAKTTLSYPLYACDFDPVDSSHVVVAGGGGAGANGVGNKITLLDASKPAELEEIGEIELSKNEDNVTSLAVGQRQGKATIVFAGVNSSSKDVEKGNNTHFRVFGIEPSEVTKVHASAQKTAPNKISEISRSKLFAGTEPDAYQRITRLSKPYSNEPQVGAVTTGMAKDSELILFDTSAISPPKSRGSVKSNKETVDVDFIQTGNNDYHVAYCNEHEIYTKKLSPQSNDEDPLCVYVIPFSDSLEKPTVPKFRSLRWLTHDLILALTNIHSNGGVVLQIFRLPSNGQGQCRIVQSHRLPSSITKATGLAVANLTPPSSPTEEQGYTQFVVAVAGQNISISLFKVDLQVENKVSLITKIKPFRTFKLVHPHQITGITFSNFTPPPYPVTASTPPQYLRLASVGVSNTVVVHTIPLFPVPLSVRKGQSKTPRYVVALPSRAATFGAGILLSIILAAFAAVFVQGVLEIRGSAEPFLNATNYIPTVWQEAIGKPYVFPKDYGHQPVGYNHHIGVPADSEDAQLFPQLIENLKANEDGDVVIVIKDTPGGNDGVKAQAHNVEVHGPHGGKTWEELPHLEREGWKKKLKSAGHWTEDMGETIFKGVVFGELAGAIGQAVAGG